MSGLLDQIEYHTSLDFASKSNDCTIIDESDFFMFKDIKQFVSFMKKTKMICLTGLVSERDNNSAEAEIVKHIGIPVFNDSSYGLNDRDILKDFQERDFVTFDQRVIYLKSELLN